MRDTNHNFRNALIVSALLNIGVLGAVCHSTVLPPVAPSAAERDEFRIHVVMLADNRPKPPPITLPQPAAIRQSQPLMPNPAPAAQPPQQPAAQPFLRVAAAPPPGQPAARPTAYLSTPAPSVYSAAPAYSPALAPSVESRSPAANVTPVYSGGGSSAAPAYAPAPAVAVPAPAPAPVPAQVVEHPAPQPAPAIVAPSPAPAPAPSPAPAPARPARTDLADGAVPEAIGDWPDINLPSDIDPSTISSSVVVISFEVNEAGRPTRIRIKRSSGNSDVDDCARRAIESMRFKPAQQGGEAVEASLEHEFQIQ